MKKEAVFLNNTYLYGHEIFFNLSEIKEEYPLHFHEFYELELLIEGEGYEIINGIKYDIKPNTLFLFHPTDYHQIIATKPLKIFNVAFTDSIIDEKNIINFLDYDNGIVINLSENKLKQVRSTIEIIRDIFYGNRSNKELILTHLVNALLLIIIGSHELKNKTITTKKQNVDVLKYIQNNFQKNPSLEELSQFCGYQKNYFCEYFKKNFNTTYKEYLSSVKINHSKKLLKLTNKSIKEIATECGFNSANNFIRKFKETSIITPKEYRQLYLKTMK